MAGLRMIDLDTYEQIIAEWQQSEEKDPVWDRIFQRLEKLSELDRQEKDAAYALELEGLGLIQTEELSK